MAIKLISIKCPECGASLDIEEGRERLFCSYCGTQIMAQNENEYIYRRIDEAGIKQAETDLVIQLKKMEMIEKERAASARSKKFKIMLSVPLFFVAIVGLSIGIDKTDISLFCAGCISATVLMVLWLTHKDKSYDFDFDDKVKIPAGISSYDRQSYRTIEIKFKSAGFTNIKCLPQNDIVLGWFSKPDMVESITINGCKISSAEINSGKKYNPDVPVVITYHKKV